MNIYQEAHERINQFPEETVYLIVQLMDRMYLNSGTGKSKSKNSFLETAGAIDIDEDAVCQLREDSKL